MRYPSGRGGKHGACTIKVTAVNYFRQQTNREKFGKSKSKDIKEKSGVDQRQTKESIELQKNR